MNITIVRANGTLSVGSEYNSELPKRAKNIGGRWNAADRMWEYDLRAEEEARKLYLDIYGQWDDEPIDFVTIRCVADARAWADQSSLQLGGRVIARAYGRDTGAKVGKGVIVESGDGFDSGGSQKNWTTFASEGTVFRVHDFPARKAAQLVEEPEWCKSVEVIKEEKIDTEALESERERLMARLKEIDAALASA